MKKIIHTVSVLFSLLALSSPLLGDAAKPRIITVGGPVTELVYALGAGDQIAATDASSQFPAEARELPQLGYVSALSAEGVLSKAPDMILATSRIGPPAVVEQLKAAGMHLMIVDNPHDAESLQAAVRDIAYAIGRKAEGEALSSRIAAGLDAAQLLKSPAGPVRVVFLMGHNGAAMAAGSETQAAGMIELANGKNVFAGFSGYKPVTEEALLAAAPDVILVGDHQGEAADGAALLAEMGLARLARLTDADVVLLDLGMFLNFGPRTGEAALKLAEIFAVSTDT